MDCDGVLTDGRLYFSPRGEELKVFHVRDGQGLVSWHRAGYVSGIISARNSPIVNTRATELGISFVKQNSSDKAGDLKHILDKSKITYDEVAFIGDDIGDIDILKIVGFPVAVSDAVYEVLETVQYKTSALGGYGAVRELTDLLLFSKSL